MDNLLVITVMVSVYFIWLSIHSNTIRNLEQKIVALGLAISALERQDEKRFKRIFQLEDRIKELERATHAAIPNR